MPVQPPPFVQAFREAAPYIQYLRGKTIVAGIESTLLGEDELPYLAADFNLLAALGIRLVIVGGCEAHIRAIAAEHGRTLSDQELAAADERTLKWAQQACGIMQLDFQAALATGLVHTPEKLPLPQLAAGNFLTAKPLGIIHGADGQYGGRVRKTDTAAINARLDSGAMVWIHPVAPSLAGQNYLLPMPETAADIAAALNAEKLVYLTENGGFTDDTGRLISTLNSSRLADPAFSGSLNDTERALAAAALHALEQGVRRVQILCGSRNGDLIRELFSRDGAGTSVSRTPFTDIRPAREADIAAITALIRPLEQEGILIRRSRRYLETHIGEFFVLEHDCQLYGCVQLKTFADDPAAAELACLAVSPHNRDGGYGHLLFLHLADTAKKLGKTRLFALSTRTADWFGERGFQAAAADELPPSRQREYLANGRRSKIFVLPL